MFPDLPATEVCAAEALTAAKDRREEHQGICGITLQANLLAFRRSIKANAQNALHRAKSQRRGNKGLGPAGTVD